MLRVLMIAIVVAAVPVSAIAQDSDRTGILYWGDTKTGKAVRVINKANAMDIAKAEMKAAGGDNWVLLVNSDKPGFGAAMCVRKGETIYFHTAHGYASSKEAVAAAKEKAMAGGGLPTFCSRALWSVNEITAETKPSSVMDVVKGTVRKAVTPEACQEKKEAPPLSEKSGEACNNKKYENKFVEKPYVCMCVRG